MIFQKYLKIFVQVKVSDSFLLCVEIREIRNIICLFEVPGLQK